MQSSVLCCLHCPGDLCQYMDRYEVHVRSLGNLYSMPPLNHSVGLKSTVKISDVAMCCSLQVIEIMSSLWMRLSPSHWCPAPSPLLLWPPSQALSAERPVHYGRTLDTVLMLHSHFLSLACSLEAPSHPKECYLSLTLSRMETLRYCQGLIPGGGPPLQWPSSSRTGEMGPNAFVYI